MKDTLLINNGIFYYGKSDKKFNQTDDPKNLSTFNQVAASTVKLVWFLSDKKQIILEYGQQDQAIVNLERTDEVLEHMEKIRQAFPQSVELNTRQLEIQLVRKPIIALAVLIILLIIVSLVDPSNDPSGASLRTNAIMELFRGLAAIGIPRIILIVGSLALIPLVTIFFRLKNVNNKKAIRLNTSSPRPTNQPTHP